MDNDLTVSIIKYEALIDLKLIVVTKLELQNQVTIYLLKKLILIGDSNI